MRSSSIKNKKRGRPPSHFCQRGHDKRIVGMSGRACRLCDNASKQRWRKNNPIKAKEHDWKNSLKYLYGFTYEKYMRLFQKQNGLCAICYRPPGPRALAVDHNHDTGHVRGLLCTNCNRGIGYLKDSSDLLQAALSYLENHSENSK